jgi:hypothetical protein
MKIKSPVVTLLVGLLIAVIVLILSINANHTTQSPYGAAAISAVAR